MRFGIALAAFAMVGCASTPPPKVAHRLRPGEIPAWLPAYSKEQQALLAPVTGPIQLKTSRTFPDLLRFGYSNNHPMESPEEGVRFTRLVATVVTGSPRFYSFDEAPAELTNDVAQYGPPGEDEPDGWSIPVRGDDGLDIVRADVSDGARSAFDRAEHEVRGGDVGGAIADYRIAVSKSPEVPQIRFSLASALEAAGKATEAEAAYRELLKHDPTFSPAHVALGEMAAKRDEPDTASREVAEALAYAPRSKRAIELAIRLGASTELRGPRRHPFPIFLDVDSAGAIHAATSGGKPRQVYAGCRAIMRFEPEVRAAVFVEPPETPYYLSVAEEFMCIEAAIGAYLIDISSGTAERDRALEKVVGVARDEGLSGFIMFEIIGPRRPERARGAPADVHRQTVKYILHRVLDQDTDQRSRENMAMGDR